MCVVLAYLLTIGCLQRVACVRKDHPGGYRLYFFYFPQNKNRNDEPLQRRNPSGVRSLWDNQSVQNIRILTGRLTVIKPRSCIGILTHLYSQMHTKRWTNPPVRFIDLRRPAADRSAVPPTTDQTISASAGCLTSNKLRGLLIKTHTSGLFFVTKARRDVWCLRRNL